MRQSTKQSIKFFKVEFRLSLSFTLRTTLRVDSFDAFSNVLLLLFIFLHSAYSCRSVPQIADGISSQT